MEPRPGKQTKEADFKWDWVVAREYDRINRSSQQSISLDKRVLKLRTLAEYYIYNDQGELKDKYKDWKEQYDSAPEYQELPEAVRWEQLRLLVRLFKQEGVFDEEDTHWENIDHNEFGPPGQTLPRPD